MSKKQIKDYRFVPGAIAEAANQYPNAVELITANKDYIIEEIIGYLTFASNTPSVAPASYPNAIAQLTNNKEFIKEEASAWIEAQIDAATEGQPFFEYNYDEVIKAKCKRDVGYLVDAWITDITGGGNADTIRIGRTYFRNGDPQLLSPTEETAVYTFLKTLINTNVLPRVAATSLQSPVVAAQSLTGSAAEAAAITRFNTLIDIIRNLIPNGLTSLPAISYNYNSAFIGYTYDTAKCRRDSGYILDSYIYDMTYGGNSSTWYVSSRYWIQGIAQVDGSRQPEILAHTFARNLINNYILQKILYPSYQLVETQTDVGGPVEASSSTKVTTLSNILLNTIQNGLSSLPRNDAPGSQGGGLMPNTVALIDANKRFIAEEAAAYIAYNVTNNISPFVFFTYNAAKCARDVSYIIEGYITDLANGGNRQTVHNASKYWENGVAAVDGSREPEISTHTFIRDLIDNYILNNVAYPAKQTAVPQTFINSIQSEVFAQTRIKELSNTVLEVIEYGLDYLPTTVSNRGYIKIQGFYKLKDFLLVTNTNRNIILYNFADPNSAAEVTYSEFADSDFPAFGATADKITTLTFDVDTTGMMVTDNIQIFVEEKYTTVKQSPIGSDAMERMKVGIPQAMLDADFEYGLQPTKWQTISLMRSYPSVYEIPGTDVQVSLVVTDASAGTAGIGASLITVTTVAAHELVVGDPITIKALANTVTGFSRAEGSFLVNSVPAANQFTFYAKSKVGTTNGQVLATTYTQLRKGDFYTGASVGQPTFSVASNGSSGSFTTNLITLSGSDFIAFTGTAPPVGAPLIAAGINTGTQITAVVGSGGTAASTTLISNAEVGESTITVNNTTGISPGLAFDRGDGRSIRVTQVLGSAISLSDPLTARILGTNASYTGLTGTYSGVDGSGAVFTVSRAGATYSASPSNPGEGYSVGQTFTISGTSLEGTAPANNATLTITAASNRKTVASFDPLSLFGGANYSQTTNIATTGGDGTGLTVDVTLDGNGTILTVAVNNAGQNYNVGNVVNIRQGRVQQANIDQAGTGYTTGTKATSTAGSGSGLTLSVTANNINGVGGLNLVSAGTGYSSGSANTTGGGGTGLVVNVQAEPVGGASTISLTNPGSGYSDGSSSTTAITGSGSGLSVNLTTSGGVISNATIMPSMKGSGYVVGNQLTVNGGNGDAVITVTAVTNGQVVGLTVDQQGSGYTNGGTITVTGGSGTATATITSVTNGQITQIAVVNPGLGYVNGDTVNILGGTGGTATIANIEGEAVIAIASVNAGGLIQTVSATGTPVSAPTRNFLSAVTLSEVTSAQIASGVTVTYSAIATIQVDFASEHGFVPGNSIITSISSTGSNHQLAAGPFYIESTPLPTRIRYTARTSGTVDTNSVITGTIYARPDSYYVHRPFDGGVQLGTGGPQHGAGAVRQSKKYIRYQSGKGVMYNTGALFAPSYDLRSATASGTAVGSLITITTDDTDHGCQVGAGINITGIATSGYNGQYIVSDVIDERTLRVQAIRTLGATSAVLTNSAQIAVRSWHGATVRAGAFDDQNGMFWQYDGQRLAVVKRSSTFQIAGVISVNSDSNAVTGTNTRFTQQLAAGDKIVLRGMSHTVTRVISDTSMTVAPDYRGVNNVSNVKICKTVDDLYPQEYWNTDPCNGSGPSGYNIDITKMQMIGLQYTWYGAGFIDFMLRGADGNYVFANRIRNSNVNTEAFMRTGNLPVRYEVTNEGAKSVLTSAMTASQTTIPLEDTYWFPNNGIVMINNELIAYTGRTSTQLTGCTRATQMSLFVGGSQRSFSAGSASTHSAGAGVILVSNTVTPIISHWGSAFLTDGRFDEDRGYIFNYTATNVSVSTTRQTAFLIRLAPSVSNAIVGDLGDRELLNKAQLLLQSIEITADTGTGGMVIEGVLNPQNYPINPADITWNGLQNAAQGGQPSFAQIAPGGSVNWSSGVETTTASATTSSSLTGSVTARMVYNNSGNLTTSPTRSITTNQRKIYFLESDYQTYINTNGLLAGDEISGTGLASGTTITSFDGFSTNIIGTLYRGVNISAFPTSNVGTVASLTVTRSYRTSSTSTIHFQQVSWESSGAKAGTEVTDVLFPANTFVSSATLSNFYGTSYYRVSFSQTSTSTAITPGTTTITFKFGQPPYAKPGETVFSFVASPGGTSNLNLDELKELTNTTLGGRGTFPNGPDVLAINVYKAAGTAINANIVLRWGEAQA
jgi:hypothetical protein